MKKNLKISRMLTILFCSAMAALLSGCSEALYYAQAISGNFRVMNNRVPIAGMLQENGTNEETRNKLKMVLEVRDFASRHLGLPKNGSYTLYSDIDGDYLGWNVFASPKFSIEPRKWCFPIAGCVVYRGYFSREAALKFARKMQQKNFDVYVAPFYGYSTLGRYDDPVISSQMRLNAVHIVGLIIHELAHQKLYIPSDSRFNEAFAVTVERAGTLRWLTSSGRDDLVEQARRIWAEEDRIVEASLRARKKLEEVYKSGLDTASMAQEKNAVFAALRSELMTGGSRFPDWGGEFSELNNAYLATIDTYCSLVPVFQSILESVGGDFPKFYEKMEALAKLSQEKRNRAIEAYQQQCNPAGAVN